MAKKLKDTTEIEYMAKDVFDAHIRSLLPKKTTIVWEKGDQPPDHFLMVDEQKFAVEVTRILDKIKVGDELMESPMIDDQLSRFAKEISEEFKSSPTLNGFYVLSMQPLPNFRTEKPELKKKINDFLISTRDKVEANMDLPSGWKIDKLNNENKGFGYIYSPGYATWEIEAKNQLIIILGEAIQKKKRKLAKFSIPKILLFVDKFIYSTNKMWQTITPQIKDSSFHTSARIILAEKKCQILWSERSELLSKYEELGKNS